MVRHPAAIGTVHGMVSLASKCPSSYDGRKSSSSFAVYKWMQKQH